MNALILHRVVGADELLERVSEIVVIAKEPILRREQRLEPGDVRFVLFRLFSSQAYELHALDLEYFAVIYLADHRRFSHYCQVAIHLHLDDTVDCFYWYFLNDFASTFRKLLEFPALAILEQFW